MEEQAHHHPERGAGLVEYALLLGLIVLVCVVSLQFLGNNVTTSYSRSGSSMFVP